MALQVGDVIALTKIAGQLLDYGFSEQLNCSKQYRDFGNDVEALSQNLNILAEVIQGADYKLRELTFSRGARLRWDSRSLYQIIGDCQRTLEECFDLLQKNSRFAPRSGPLKSIEWNLLVQGDVDALRKRIKQHSIKIHLALAPFEIDLLSRIQEDIHRMHRDLADRIDRVHEDVLRIRGVIIPDLQQELNQKETRAPHTLQVPLNLEYAFESAFSARDFPSLSDLADIFVLFFYQSTVSFKPPTPLARDKVPPYGQYVNLLKCVWLMQRIRASEELQPQMITLESHWPSYVEELEKVLSEQCRRFEGELTAPSQPNLTPDVVAIWPARRESSPLGHVQKEEMIESILDTKIKHASEDRKLSIQLLRRLDPGGTEFRINISDPDQSRRTNLDPIDFDLRTTILTPHYAVDPNPPFDMIIETGLRMTSLHFMELKEAMRFQHATTGYRVLGYKQFLVDVKFVFSSQKEMVPVHKACVQIWIPSQKDGNLSTTSESQMDSRSPIRAGNMSSPVPIRSSTAQSSRTAIPSFFQDPFQPPSQPENHRTSFFDPQRQSTINSTYLSPLQMENSQFPDLRRRQQSTGDRHSPLSTSGPSHLGYLTGRTMLSSSPPTDQPMLPGSHQNTRHTSLPNRSPSVSTTRPQPSMTTARSSGSSGSDHTLTIATGSGNTGVLHVPPARPLLVLLTQNSRTGARSMVTLDLTTTDVNPERCNCRRVDAKGLACCDVSLERSGGNEGKPLEARRFEPPSPAAPDWDVSRLAYARRNEADAVRNTQWKDLTRVTVTFQNPADKAKFTGGWCRCKNRGKPKETGEERRSCVNDGHRGLLGQAKEVYLDKKADYDNWRNNRQQVVNGLRPDGWQ